MIITNPTKNDISVVIKGIKYTIKAEDSLERVPEDHARYWQESLHKFLQLKKDKDEVKSKSSTSVTAEREVSVEIEAPVIDEEKKDTTEVVK